MATALVPPGWYRKPRRTNSVSGLVDIMRARNVG